MGWIAGAWATGAWRGTAWAVQDAPVTVSDVVGETQAAGTATLEGDGFVVAVETAYSGVVAAGLIISQNPVGGSSAASGSTVTITVSLGPEPQNTQQTPAGKSRKHRYFVEVDGETFEAENASHALAILDRALELAPKAAEEAAEEVEHKLARHNVARRIGLATPKIATDAPINLEPFRTRLKQVYRNAAVEAELRLHMAMLAKLEEEDEDRAAEILLLH